VSKQEEINRTGQKYIEGLRAVVAQLWKQACGHDDIPSGSKFVVFSEDNPYVVFYNNVMKEFMEARKQYCAGGYVGLKIYQGRAKCRAT